MTHIPLIGGYKESESNSKKKKRPCFGFYGG